MYGEALLVSTLTLFFLSCSCDLGGKGMANDESMQNFTLETLSPELLSDWKPSRLSELASNGLPFSPTFILPESGNNLAASVSCAGSAAPFGFHFWRQHAIGNRPVIDVTRGY